MRKIGLLASMALLSVLMGCSGATDNPSATPTATMTVTKTVTAASSSSPSASHTPNEPNVGARALDVGQWREGTGARTLVSSIKQPSEVTPPSYLQGEGDAEGALLRVKVCVRKSYNKPMPVSSYDFFLYDKAGGEYTVGGSSWDEWPPGPQLPSDTKVAAGRCVTGWVLFPMQETTRIVRASYGSGADAVAEWRAP